MPRLTFTTNLQRHVSLPDADVPGQTVREVLEAAFARNPQARSYVLDEQGMVRRHVAVFVNGALITDRVGQSDAVGADGEVTVMQALSGG
jgi:molybdopterin converting factor small subunit